MRRQGFGTDDVKRKVTIADIMRHEGGLWRLDRPFAIDHGLPNVDKLKAILEKEALHNYGEARQEHPPISPPAQPPVVVHYPALSCYCHDPPSPLPFLPAGARKAQAHIRLASLPW